jgi:hypothetical protein
VEIDAPCLDCGEPVHLEVKDGNILNVSPQGLIGHVSVPLLKWAAHVPFARSTMHFFRSEEHLRSWAGFDTEKEGGIISLADLVNWFSIDFFRRRSDADYVSRIWQYASESHAKLREIGKKGLYWLP